MSIITISRGSLSGGERLAHNLQKRLGYKLISREVIVEAAKKYGVAEQKLAEEMQSPSRLWKRLTDHKQRYVLAVQATLAEMVEEGSSVYCGLAGHLLLRGLSRVLKVRLIAPMEFRVRAAMAEQGLAPEDAHRYLQTVDEQRSRWVRQLYDVDWGDPSLYDLVINLEHMTIDSATDLVVDVVRSKEFAKNPEHVREFRDFSLATRVRAALTFHSDFPPGSVIFSTRNGVVYLTGGSSVDRNAEAVASFVGETRGVQQVVLPGEDDHGVAEHLADLPVEKRAVDIMVPVQRYPHIPQSITIRDAIVALSASSVVLKDGHLLSPRYVLVLDEMERLAGIVGRRDLLRGLAPHLKTLERAREIIESVVPFADLSYSSSPWVSFFSRGAITNSREPVKSIMAPLRGTVRASDDLSVVVTTMLQHNVDMVPVVDGDRAVGVVLMTDVFDTVAQYVVEKGGQQRPADDP